MSNIIKKLQLIAEASRHQDGRNTPLSDQIMDGVSEIIKLRQALFACVVMFKNSDRSPSEQAVYDFARQTLESGEL